MIDVYMGGWIEVYGIYGKMDRRKDGWKDGWIGIRMEDEWMHGRMYRSKDR